MSQRPDKTVKLTGKNDFEKSLLKLREGWLQADRPAAP
jgi:hypothetical protein